MLERTDSIGFVLIIWVFAVAGQFAIYYHAKAVMNPTGKIFFIFLVCVYFVLFDILRVPEIDNYPTQIHKNEKLFLVTHK